MSVLVRILLWRCVYNLQNVVLWVLNVYVSSLFLVDEPPSNWIWRKLHHEEFHDLYCSQNTIRTIKLRRNTWVGHAARIGERISCTIFIWRVKVREHLEDVTKTILKQRGSLYWIHLADDRLVHHKYKTWSVLKTSFPRCFLSRIFDALE
jgi:hypothetical protein